MSFHGLRPSARQQLVQRDYRVRSLAERLASTGVEAGELLGADRSQLNWIPGVEIFARKVYPQRHRGFFAEVARSEEPILKEIGFWPKQWASARMFAGTAKGFHIHPPHVPEGQSPGQWFQRLFVGKPANYGLRCYDREQWDLMFFLQGGGEMILVDEREGMERRIMRFLIEGDDHRGPNNAGVVIPPGVAHAIRAEGSADVIMLYGTSTVFDPANEGRLASGVESAPLPAEWQEYLSPKDAQAEELV
jgi:dTDP-4-dehydrorhamnose 3,5-epimerase-like enzyme